MDYRDLYLFQTYHPYREKELIERADRERLALSVVHSQRKLRFYYPAMVRFGRWLISSGHHLQKRYGEMCEISSNQPAHRNA